MSSDGYNGWSNWATWNVALWIGNDEGLYALAKRCRNYKSFVQALAELDIVETPNQASYSDPTLDIDALNAMIDEL